MSSLFDQDFLNQFIDADFFFDSKSDDDVEMLNIEGASNISIRTKIIHELMDLFVRHKFTSAALEDIAKLLNKMPNASIQIPTTKYRLVQEMLSTSNLKYSKYYFCAPCGVYSKCSFTSEKKRMCTNCKTIFVGNENEYFVNFELKSQLETVIKRNWKEIEEYKAVVLNKTSDDIQDIFDGNILKNLKRRNVWRLTMNTDGISLAKSNNCGQ